MIFVIHQHSLGPEGIPRFGTLRIMQIRKISLGISVSDQGGSAKFNYALFYHSQSYFSLILH